MAKNTIMQVKSFIFNDFREITYIVFDETTHQGIIIDPGCNKPSEQKRLTGFIEKNNIELTAIVNTHGHLDHICGNKFVKETYQIPIYIHQKELSNLESAPLHAEFYGFSFEPSPLPDQFIKEGDTITFGHSTLHIVETPGHTEGSISLLSPQKEALFSGDVLFKGSIGRTDLPGGDLDVLLSTLKNKILTLPDTTTIFPGHGYETTVGEEIKTNPFLTELVNEKREL